jgi:inosine-uridine nucleoside N-ribohydrolase
MAEPATLREQMEAALSSAATEADLRALMMAAVGQPEAATTAAAAPEPEPQVPRIILDCDPGGDDVVAMFWLLAMQSQKACKVLAVTTTQGNVKAPLTFAAADKVLTLLSSVVDADIPVCAQTPLDARWGSSTERSASRSRYASEMAKNTVNDGTSLDDAAHIHGCDGMGGLGSQLPARGDYSSAPESYERLIEELKAAPHQVTVLATGPLTNLADAERASPGILKLAKRVRAASC